MLKRVMRNRAGRRMFWMTLLVGLGGIACWQRDQLVYYFDRDDRGPDLSLKSSIDPSYRTPNYLRVLFIGNSFTEFNGTQPLLVARIADAERKQHPEIKFTKLEMVQIYGGTLRRHWLQRHSPAAQRIREGNWDYIVLQEHSRGTLTPEGRQDMFRYAEALDEQIKALGAKTILFMTWADEDRRDDEKIISATYMQLARKLGAKVAPVGLAFEKARQTHPEIALTQTYDRKHPTEAGSYLAACVFYQTLLDRQPTETASHLIDERGRYVVYLNSAVAHALQDVARQTVQEFQQPVEWASQVLPQTRPVP